ncbi:hypothetical protein BC936DRAFT_144305 [Jimgerdemannia flammicorona]|uniref:Uncharacterized protein n=1 Tax=Jimgerdemannia flammicorona TaxID=994334 RepID=A0A433DCN4_9FUNG|nr:hypothetical protein BC936DRAFT_144305 [Jimgerdemannia flammicorona]
MIRAALLSVLASAMLIQLARGNYYFRGPEGEQYAPGTTSDPWTTVDPRLISNAIGDDGQPPTLFGSPFGDEVLTDKPVNILSVFFG